MFLYSLITMQDIYVDIQVFIFVLVLSFDQHIWAVVHRHASVCVTWQKL